MLYTAYGVPVSQFKSSFKLQAEIKSLNKNEKVKVWKRNVKGCPQGYWQMQFMMQLLAQSL